MLQSLKAKLHSSGPKSNPIGTANTHAVSMNGDRKGPSITSNSISNADMVKTEAMPLSSLTASLAVNNKQGDRVRDHEGIGVGDGLKQNMSQFEDSTQQRQQQQQHSVIEIQKCFDVLSMSSSSDTGSSSKGHVKQESEHESSSSLPPISITGEKVHKKCSWAPTTYPDPTTIASNLTIPTGIRMGSNDMIDLGTESPSQSPSLVQDLDLNSASASSYGRRKTKSRPEISLSNSAHRLFGSKSHGQYSDVHASSATVRLSASSNPSTFRERVSETFAGSSRSSVGTSNRSSNAFAPTDSPSASMNKTNATISTPSNHISNKQLKNMKFVIVVLGIDSAGSTSIIRTLKPKIIKTRKDPGKLKVEGVAASKASSMTVGVDYFEVYLDKYHHLDIFNVGGEEGSRGLWRMYLGHAGGLVFVVDASDPSRIAEVRDELHLLLFGSSSIKEHVNVTATNIPLLVLANKSDIAGSFSESEISDLLHIRLLPVSCSRVLRCSARSGNDVREGFEWLVEQMVLRQTMGVALPNDLNTKR